MSDRQHLRQPPSQQLQPNCFSLQSCGLGKIRWPLATAASAIAFAAALIVHDLTKNGYTVTFKKDDATGKQIEDFTIKPTKLGDPRGDMKAAWAHAVAGISKTDGHENLGLTMISCEIDE